MNILENKKYSMERALYSLKNTNVKNCKFYGKEDGESSLKECKNIIVESSYFALRYPLWHANKYQVINSEFTKKSRAPFWYTKNGFIYESNIMSIKALRESKNVKISNSKIESDEFGWKCKDISIKDSEIKSMYAFLDSKNVTINNLNFTGKYSFQYIDKLLIENSILKTKDAFWHTSNAVIKNSIIEGEYLGWYSKNLTLENCKIIGTQPFCYCENLKLINCEMIDTDLAFELSSVNAVIKGNVLSIKNPKSGVIKVDSVDEIIIDEHLKDNNCKIIQRKERKIK